MPVGGLEARYQVVRTGERFLQGPVGKESYQGTGFARIRPLEGKLIQNHYP